MVASVSRVHARVVPLLAALTVGAALPAGAVAQTAAPQLPGLSDEPPPWEGGAGEETPGGSEPGGEEPGGDGGAGGGEPSGEGGGSEPSGGGDLAGSTDGTHRPAADELPRTGSEPLLLGLSGAALALLGTGLRLRTLDADLF